MQEHACTVSLLRLSESTTTPRTSGTLRHSAKYIEWINYTRFTRNEKVISSILIGSSGKSL